MANERGLYIILISIHGLLRGTDLELGRDPDTGGQTTYVLELARTLSCHPKVAQVALFTRRVNDSEVAPEYAQQTETIADNARLVRIK